MRFLRLAALALAIMGGYLGVTSGTASATPLSAGAIPGIATGNPLVEEAQYRRRRYYRPYRAYRPVYRPQRRYYRPYRGYRPVYRPQRRYYRPYRGYRGYRRGPAVRFRF